MAERKKPGPKAAAKPRDAAREAAAEAPAEPLPAPTVHGHFPSPVDLPEASVPLPHPLRWTTTVVVVATLLLALFNAGALRGWAYQLRENAVSAQVVTAAEGWFDATAALGLDRPVATVHGWWEAVKAWRVGGQAVPQDAADSVTRA